MVASDSRDFPGPPEDRPRFIDERCDRYEEEWRALQAPRIEDYLGDVEGETRVALWLELVMLDQELRRGKGEEPTLADYRESCPDRMVFLDLSTDELGPIAEAAPRTAGSDAGDRRTATVGAADGSGPDRGPVRADRRR